MDFKRINNDTKLQAIDAKGKEAHIKSKMNTIIIYVAQLYSNVS